MITALSSVTVTGSRAGCSIPAASFAVPVYAKQEKKRTIVFASLTYSDLSLVLCANASPYVTVSDDVSCSSHSLVVTASAQGAGGLRSPARA